MADNIIAKRIGGISDEIAKIPDALSKLAPDPDKKYYDENLGDVIKESVLSVLGKVSEVEAGKNYYYTEVVELVKDALVQVISKIGNPKIDLSPIMKMASDINADNKKILDAILNQPKPETNDSKYQELLMTMQRTNELLIAVLAKKEAPVIDITPRKDVESWRFLHKIEYNRIVETEAIPKYKA
jgi:hypothetical protein